ncbi:MAG TPA: hypothetical protein DCP85_11500 [Elusimicrobia bacterium]|nr:hypothetical protein [Elusimicrobiota bacterium]
MALLRVTSRCNQRCAFCSYPADGEERLGGLKSWLEELSGQDGGLVQISGGEPLLRRLRDLLALLKLCARRGIRAEFQTNAVLLADFDARELRALVQAVAKTSGYFNVNFPSHCPAVDARITGSKDNFAKRERGVRRLLEAGAQVRITHVVNSLNYRFIPGFIVYVDRRLAGAAWVQFSFAKAAGRALLRPGIVPSYRQASGPLRKGLRKASSLGIKCEVDHIPVCFIRDYWTCHVDVRKLLGRKPGPHQFEKQKTAKCAGCSFSRVCAGPRLDYLALGKTF